MTEPVLITASTGSVVSVSDLVAHSSLSGAINAPDDELRRMLDDAVVEAEIVTRRRFLTQTWDQSFDAFCNPLVLRYPPLRSITSVKYVDTAGVTQTVSTDIYEAGDEDGIGIVRLKYLQLWPTGVRSHPDSVIVQFECGYGDTSDVPETIKRAIRVHAAHHFENREGQSMGNTFTKILFPYRVVAC